MTGGRTNSHGCFHGCAQGTVASGECESGIKAIFTGYGPHARRQFKRSRRGQTHTHTVFFFLEGFFKLKKVDLREGDSRRLQEEDVNANVNVKVTVSVKVSKCK